MKKILSIFIALTLIFSPIISIFSAEEQPLILPDIIANETNNYTNRLVLEEPNLNSFVFENEDGSRTLRIFSHPVKFVNDQGQLQDITNTVIKNEQHDFESESNSIKTVFSQNLSNGVRLSYEDISLRLTPQKVANETLSAFSSAAVLQNNQTISYAHSLHTSLEYSLTYTGFKEDIVVSQYTGQTEYHFTLQTNGLNVEKQDDSFYIVNNSGDIKATIGDIIILTADNKNNAFGNLVVTAIKEHELYLLTIKISPDYLKDPKTKYPIRIDPTIEVNFDNNGTSAIQDVTINNNDTGSTSNGSSGSLYVGKRSSSRVARVLMKFPGLNISTLPGAGQINNATVVIRDLMCEGTPLAISCYVFNGNSWSDSNANWTTVNPNNYSTLLSTNTISFDQGSENSPAHFYSYNITAAVRGWKNGTYDQNKGIIFKASSEAEESSNVNYKTFASYNRSAYKPSLSVNYRTVSTVATISEAPYSTALLISANTSYKFTFTPLVTSKYSFWTTQGIATNATDTKIDIYSDSALSNCIESDDDGGHDFNACATVSMVAGHTYYIVLQGYSSSTSGSCLFFAYRGLPLSGSEKGTHLDIFNQLSNRPYNNCYTYALSTIRNPITELPYGTNGVDPGELAGLGTIGASHYSSLDSIKEEIEYRVKADCVAWGGSEDDFFEVEEDEMVPEGYYKIALLADIDGPSFDYHWLRQTSELDGAWAHKPGMADVITFSQNHETEIFVPSQCTFDYYEFIAYYAIKPPENSLGGISDVLRSQKTTLLQQQNALKVNTLY